MTGARTHLLVIEDDPQIQRFLATALDAHGYALTAATTGNEGVQAAATRQPDIVIVDLGLPDISGLDVIQRLREWFARPIIVLSARDKETDKVAALDLGADDYLTKPFGIGELLARLRVAERHLSARSGAPGGAIVSTASPSTLGHPISAKTAAELNQMMQLVVAGGTGTAAQIPGVPVAGKTGTAELGLGTTYDAWFVAFAPADNPRYVVAVVVEKQPNGFGGSVSAPIAKTILEKLLHR